jgi:hypothetical protein
MAQRSAKYFGSRAKFNTSLALSGHKNLKIRQNLLMNFIRVCISLREFRFVSAFNVRII